MVLHGNGTPLRFTAMIYNNNKKLIYKIVYLCGKCVAALVEQVHSACNYPIKNDGSGILDVRARHTLHAIQNVYTVTQ